MPDPETLAREAEGDSVTPERLVGDADGFPNLGPYPQSGQEPQHVLPLEPSGTAMQVGVGYVKDPYADSPPREVKSTQSVVQSSGSAVAVLTWDEVLAVAGGTLLEIPYEAISGVLHWSDLDIEIHRTGARDCVFYLADDADESEVRAAVSHLRKGVRHHRSDDRR